MGLLKYYCPLCGTTCECGLGQTDNSCPSCHYDFTINQIIELSSAYVDINVEENEIFKNSKGVSRDSNN